MAARLLGMSVAGEGRTIAVAATLFTRWVVSSWFLTLLLFWFLWLLGSLDGLL